MTIDKIVLKELVEKGSDAVLLSETIAFIAGRMMELELEGLTGAAHAERSPTRVNQRDGYRERIWETRAGIVALELPELRKSCLYEREFVKQALTGTPYEHRLIGCTVSTMSGLPQRTAGLGLHPALLFRAICS